MTAPRVLYTVEHQILNAVGGVRINLIPQSGGNVFSASLYVPKKPETGS